MKNGRSAAKSLLNEKGSTTIPRKGSKVENFLLEKPNTIIKHISKIDIDKGSGIYCLYNSISDKCYVGRTVNFRKRLQEHIRNLISGKHYNKYLQRSFTKMGVFPFYYFIVEECPTEICEERELHYIDYFNSYNKGYNNTRVTSVNFQTEDIIAKNKERRQIKVACLNLDGKFIQYFESVTNAAKYFNTSTSNISGCCKNKLRCIKNHIFIYAHEYDPFIDNSLEPIDYSFRKSEEYKSNMSKKLKGRKQSIEHRHKLMLVTGTKVKCVDDNQIYHSLQLAGERYKISRTSIARAIKDKRRCKGLLFEIVKI